jgi:hypothetical protein
MRHATRIPAVLVLAVLCAATQGADAQSPPLEELLDRATAYVSEFFNRFSNVVAEEHYEQEMPPRRRRLRSDFLLVTFPGLDGRMSFRDVFEVDGRAVREPSQQDRLLKLVANAPRDVIRRAREITAASARYVLADLESDPFIALGFLQATFRPRFRFVRGGLEKDLRPDVRTVRFDEWQRPTVLRSGPNDDLPSRGLLWIEETTGRVVKTELLLGSRTHGRNMVTTYRWDEELQMNVPAELREWYSSSFRGVAKYSRFRRFEVHTEETLR